MNRLKVVRKYFCLFLAVGCLGGQMLAQQMPSKADKQFEMGLYKEAAEGYRQMIDSEAKDDIRCHERLAECYLSINKPFEAVATYEEAAMKFDMSADSYMNWASALKKIGRNEEANEIISFASIKGNVNFEELAISDMIQYEIRQASFNSKGNEFAPAFLGGDIICVTDNYNSLQVTGVSTRINELPHVLMRIDLNTGQKARLRGKLKDYINDGPSSYSDDGSMVCFSKGHFPASQSPKIGNKQSGSIYLAETDDQGDWDVMVSLPCNELGVANIYPHLQDDGQRVYFASNREGGFGGFDIYYTDRIGDGWSSPKNLGSNVNTDGDEISPSLDAEILYFASNKHSGFGGFDLFSIDKMTISSPVNMGEGINSSWDDYAMITNNEGETGYFTSNRSGGAGGEDIYTFRRTVKMPASQPVAASSSTASAKPTTAASAKSTTASAKLMSLDLQSATSTTSTASAKPTTNTSFEDIPTFKLATPGLAPEGIKTVYTIQVAALSQDNNSYRSIVANLKDIGFVYKVVFHNVIKIRVGQYDTELEARKILEKVKARGYKDAFVVKEELIRDEIKSTTKHTTSHLSPTSSISREAQYEKPTETTTTYKPDIPKEDYDKLVTNLSRYRIKLGSYTDISTFEDAEVKRYGSIFKEESGEWTKVYLGDYMTIEDAEAIRVEVQKAGFTSAIIYGIRGDELVKMR